MCGIVEKKQDILFLLFLIVTNAAVILNIPIYRQVLGGIFLTFLPGLFILCILKLNEITQLKKIILTIGLSLSFIMFYGLLINYLVLSLGYKDPLSEKWLLLTFNFAIIILYYTNNFTNKGKIITFQINLNQSLNEKLAMLSFIAIFTSLSIFGAYLMRTNGNNIVLMFGFFLIIFIMVLVTILNHKVPKNIYPLAIYSIGVFITLAFSLRSEYIVGADVHSEYYLFRVTMDILHWKILDYSALDACLSISLLPAIYQSILNISHTVFFYKVLYSVLIPVIPLAVYEISRKYVDEIFAFFAALFFASSHVFMWTAASPRTNLAILFFVLAIMVLFTDMKLLNKRLLFIIFMSSTIMSHYSTAYIFFFVLLTIYFLMQLVKIRYPTVENLSSISVILFFVLIFFWYSQITRGAFNYSAMGFFEGIIRDFYNIFILDSRGGAVPEVLGVGFLDSALPRQIHIINQWIVMITIFVGIISIIVNYTKMIDFPLNKKDISIFLRRKIEILYLLLAIACFGILIFCIILPQASTGLGTQRVYFQMMGALSFIFIIGCISISKYIKITPYLIILIILIPYFISNTGIIYQLNNIPHEPTFTSEGNLYKSYYIEEDDMKSAEWLSKHYNPDIIIQFISEGGNRIFRDLQKQDSTFSIKFTDIKKVPKIDGYLYLTRVTVVDGIFITTLQYTGYYDNILKYFDVFEKKSKIYTNGGSETYL